MPRVQGYLLHDFNNNPEEAKLVVEVKEGAKLLDCKATPTGIVIWFEESTLQGIKSVDRNFKIIGKDGAIPDNSTFVSIVDVVIPGEVPGEERLVIMPVYELPKKVLIKPV